jgi:hypothetical protein
VSGMFVCNLRLTALAVGITLRVYKHNLEKESLLDSIIRLLKDKTDNSHHHH